MTSSVEGSRLERKRREVVRSRSSADRHHYFHSVADARYVLRKVFRIVEEQAKKAGLDPLAHQAMLQIYGSPEMQMRIKDLAERLDITPAFASVIVKDLRERGLVSRLTKAENLRVTRVTPTRTGRELLDAIDNEVKVHVDYFARGLAAEERERAVAILLFYVGLSVRE